LPDDVGIPVGYSLFRLFTEWQGKKDNISHTHFPIFRTIFHYSFFPVTDSSELSHIGGGSAGRGALPPLLCARKNRTITKNGDRRNETAHPHLNVHIRRGSYREEENPPVVCVRNGI